MTTLSIDDAAWASPWRRRRVGEKVLLSLALLLTALLLPPWPGCVAVALVSVFAIVGPARGDIFTGSGFHAGQLAGTVRNHADFVILVPRAAAGRFL